MRRLASLSPVLLPLLVDVLQHIDQDVTRDLDSLEFMAGQGEITKAADRLGLASIGYDKTYSSTAINDINSKMGFARAMSLTLRVRRHGSIWRAPVCSSWVWISRSGSDRTQQHAGGNTKIPRIRSGNTMVVRLVLIMLVAWCRGCHLFMENPASTIIQYFSPLRELIACILKHKVGVDLSAYGTEVPKPSIV